jgi:hypothetical protein
MADKPFVDGIRYWPPKEGRPDFVVGSVSIEPKRLLEFFKANSQYMKKGYFNIEILRRKDGDGWSFVLDTYQKPRD